MGGYQIPLRRAFDIKMDEVGEVAVSRTYWRFEKNSTFWLLKICHFQQPKQNFFCIRHGLKQADNTSNKFHTDIGNRLSPCPLK